MAADVMAIMGRTGFPDARVRAVTPSLEDVFIDRLAWERRATDASADHDPNRVSQGIT